MFPIRRLRPKLQPQDKAYFHIVSRVVDRRFILGDAEKQVFLSLMRRYEAFSCVKVVGYCVMSNHFHLLVEAVGRPEGRPSEAALLDHVQGTLGQRIADHYRERLHDWRGLAAEQEVVRLAKASEGCAEASATSGMLSYAEQQYEKVLADIWQRMFNVSAFVQGVKQQFSTWYNKSKERRGTLWEERFSCTVVQGGAALAEMAAYIDLNPVRAGLVEDPKDYVWSQYGAAVAGDSVARGAVLLVAQCYAALTGEELVEWGLAQGRYRMLMYRRGLIRVCRGGELEGVFSPGEVEEVRMGQGALPPPETALPPENASRKLPPRQPEHEPKGISYVGGRIRYFTEGLAIGGREYLDELFGENKSYFGSRRRSGARKMRGGDWGSLRSLRDLQKGSSSI